MSIVLECVSNLDEITDSQDVLTKLPVSTELYYDWNKQGLAGECGHLILSTGKRSDYPDFTFTETYDVFGNLKDKQGDD